MNKSKTMSQLKNIFRTTENKGLIPEKERKGYMDSSNVMMVIPKTYEMLDVLKCYYVEENKIPELSYLQTKEMNCFCTYSGEYLKVILELMKATGNYSTVKIGLNHEYPLWFETYDFVVILAPRISNE